MKWLLSLYCSIALFFSFLKLFTSFPMLLLTISSPTTVSAMPTSHFLSLFSFFFSTLPWTRDGFEWLQVKLIPIQLYLPLIPTSSLLLALCHFFTSSPPLVKYGEMVIQSWHKNIWLNLIHDVVLGN